MAINADFGRRVIVHAAREPWIDSPMAGVQRRPLDRVGNEVARATSLVRYALGSHFSPHVHTGGEEFLVLDGVFQDEHGDFPAGSYIRNPINSRHTPGSEPGCTIFVKLWQFEPDDFCHVRVRTDKMQAIPNAVLKGVSTRPLFQDDVEEVALHSLQPGAALSMFLPGGAELLVLDGDLEESGDTLQVDSWLRVPPGGQLDATAGNGGARIWIKTGHLLRVDAEIERLKNY